jgi:hypothetical protein
MTKPKEQAAFGVVISPFLKDWKLKKKNFSKRPVELKIRLLISAFPFRRHLCCVSKVPN